jgi:hypothetical protein
MGNPSKHYEARYCQNESLPCNKRDFVMVFGLKEREKKAKDYGLQSARMKTSCHKYD